jgi:hypothetical protein
MYQALYAHMNNKRKRKKNKISKKKKIQPEKKKSLMSKHLKITYEVFMMCLLFSFSNEILFIFSAYSICILFVYLKFFYYWCIRGKI